MFSVDIVSDMTYGPIMSSRQPSVCFSAIIGHLLQYHWNAFTAVLIVSSNQLLLCRYFCLKKTAPFCGWIIFKSSSSPREQLRRVYSYGAARHLQHTFIRLAMVGLLVCQHWAPLCNLTKRWWPIHQLQVSTIRLCKLHTAMMTMTWLW